jgi:predicted nucleic acid-binding protein
MSKYHDVPMDVADASLVALAESLAETHVFTLDSHFRAYRLRDRRAFRIMPG